jgi:hypothetical protein
VNTVRRNRNACRRGSMDISDPVFAWAQDDAVLTMPSF